MLLLTDWVLKRWDAAPAARTGKLSDVAGLVFAPLLCTAVLDLVLMVAARAGAPVDYRLGPRRLLAAVLATGALFTAVKLSSAAAATLVTAAGAVGLDWHIVSDPTDLLALPALGVALWVGRREIRCGR